MTQASPAILDSMRSQLEATRDPKELRTIEGELEAYEKHLEAGGLLEELSPVRELRMRARWHLGRALADAERSPGARKASFRGLLKSLGLTHTTAIATQRVAALPEEELERAFAEAREAVTLITVAALVTVARPYWAKERRQAKHKEIAEKSSASSVGIGTFALIYADPPWKFATYSEKGLAMASPDNHYPTMAIEDIAQLEVDGRKIAQLAAKDAGLFMWCTSSNLELALPILRCWGFTYRTHLVWDKVRTGTGYIWLNQHELLLYAKRGEFPMPAAKFSSVFTVERTAHSEKPAGIRFMLESMYPEFTAENRIELFARGEVEGWTTWGNQA